MHSINSLILEYYTPYWNPRIRGLGLPPAKATLLPAHM